MFGNIGFGEIMVTATLALLIFGPERLPRAAADAARMIRQLRALTGSAMDDLKSELPPDLAGLDLRTMHPRTVLRDALSGGPALRPIDEIPAADAEDGDASGDRPAR